MFERRRVLAVSDVHVLVSGRRAKASGGNIIHLHPPPTPTQVHPSAASCLAKTHLIFILIYNHTNTNNHINLLLF